MANRRDIWAKLEGLDRTMRSMRGLKEAVQRRILRKALNEVSGPILKDAKRRAPRDSGLLRRSLARKTWTSRRNGVVVVIIGPRTGFKREVAVKEVYRQIGGKTVRITNPRDDQKRMVRNPTQISHLVEFGTVHREAKAFLRPAYEAGKSQAESTLRRRVAQEIEKEARKLAKGGRR